MWGTRRHPKAPTGALASHPANALHGAKKLLSCARQGRSLTFSHWRRAYITLSSSISPLHPLETETLELGHQASDTGLERVEQARVSRNVPVSLPFPWAREGSGWLCGQRCFGELLHQVPPRPRGGGDYERRLPEANALRLATTTCCYDLLLPRVACSQITYLPNARLVPWPRSAWAARGPWIQAVRARCAWAR